MATGRYSTFPTVIDKLKLLPELKDMTVGQVGKIARYNELIIKGKNGTLTSAEQLELDALHQEMKTYNLSPTDWNTVISAMINIEKYLNDTILPEIGTMVDNAESQINTSVTNGVNIVDNKVNSVIPQIDKYISDLITNPTNAVTIGHLRNQFIITNETNIIAIGIHGFNANTDVLTLTVSGTQYYEYKNGNGDYTIDTSNNTITLVGTKKFYVDEIVLIEVVKNVMKSVPTMDVSLVADNSILRVKLDQDTQNAINDIANKQNKTDNTLTTTDKTIVGGINEVNDKATVLTEHLGDYVQHKEQLATSTEHGHIKIGNGVNVNEDGVISVKTGVVDVNGFELVPKVEINTMTTVDVSKDFPMLDTLARTTSGPHIYAMAEDTEFIYTPNSTTLNTSTDGILKIRKSDMKLVANNSSIQNTACVFVDDLYVYTVPSYSASEHGVVKKLNKSDLTLVASSPATTAFQYILHSVEDTDYIYLCGSKSITGVIKLSKADLSIVAQDKTFNADYYMMVVDTNNLYISHRLVGDVENTARTIKLDKDTFVRQADMTPTNNTLAQYLVDMGMDYLLITIQPTSSTSSRILAVVRKSDMKIERSTPCLAINTSLSFLDKWRATWRDNVLYSVMPDGIIGVDTNTWIVTLNRTGINCDSILLSTEYTYISTTNSNVASIIKTKAIAGQPNYQEQYYDGDGMVSTALGVAIKSIDYKIKYLLKKEI